MVIKTELRISSEEIDVMITEHLAKVHKLNVDYIAPQYRNNGTFDGFKINIQVINTSLEEIHENTPTFVKEKEKVVIS